MAVLVALTGLAFANSFSVPLLFDDFLALHNNPSINVLRNLGAVLAPPNDAPTAGRPLLNLSFAINYALHGYSVRGYHAVNLALHIGVALALFGVVRRTLMTSPRCVDLAPSANALALAMAAIWAVHPVQTGSVTYVSQRAELLMGLFYLLTFYSFVRGAAAPRQPVWLWLSAFACAAGMLSKESMVTAPALVLLADWLFFAGTFKAAVERRGGYYLGLLATWVILGALMLKTQIGARGVGYAEDVTAVTYALTQSRVVLEYARLAVWPFPLVFDYGREVLVTRFGEVWLHVGMLSGILAGTTVAVLRRSRTGFLVAAFFVLLAPSSSVVPVVHQPMAENRMYLPLAAVAVLTVLALYRWLRRGWMISAAVLVIALVLLTVDRNRDYRSAAAIWSDTLMKRPKNFRAHNHFADALRNAGDLTGSMRHSRQALQLAPDNDVAHNNLGVILTTRPETLLEGVAHLEKAVQVRPNYAPLLVNLGNALLSVPGRQLEAVEHLRAATRANSGYADGHVSLGSAVLRLGGSPSEALRSYAEALRLNPRNVKVHTNVAVAYAALRRFREAAHHAQLAVDLDPNYADARVNLANALLQFPGRQLEALVHCQRATELQPDHPQAWQNLGVALAAIPGREAEAIAALEKAITLNPQSNVLAELLTQVRARVAR